ncbi:unnamed protein product [Echinostoma caproni]|uniref:Uncharacterized protein n=1 Tax=Echinostoma caproni TaxID=27848 RepID=A0A183AQK9_9TREM|nr:unnamed protein product [Echinostoma caproni]
MESDIPNTHLTEYRMASTDLLCPSQCCTSGFEEVPVFLVQTTDVVRDPALMIRAPTHVLHEQHDGAENLHLIHCTIPNEENRTSSPRIAMSTNNHWIPVRSSTGVNPPTGNSFTNRRQPTRNIVRAVRSRARTQKCICHSWENWRNLFAVVLALCSVIFIVSDLYHLTQLEIAAFGLQPPISLTQANGTHLGSTISRMYNPNHYYHIDNGLFGTSWDPSYLTGTSGAGLLQHQNHHQQQQQQRLFHRELLMDSIPEDVLLCLRRWKSEWASMAHLDPDRSELNAALQQKTANVL